MEYFAGIDVGGTNIAVGIINKSGNVIFQTTRPTDPEGNFNTILYDINEAIEYSARTAGIRYSDIVSIGAGIPGAVEADGQTVIIATNLAWENVPFGQKLERMSGKKVYLGNDADCAVLAEAFCGSAAGAESAVMLTLGTGVGGGVIINRELFSGCLPGGTELGHVTLVYEGKKCACGRRGCIEKYVSASALIEQTREKMGEHEDSLMWKYSPELYLVNGETAFNAAKAGDKWAKCVIEKYISYTASAISGLVNIFRPELVIIGGGISNQGDYFIKPLEAEVKKQCFGLPFLNPPSVKAAKLGNTAGIIGAALLCRRD